MILVWGTGILKEVTSEKYQPRIGEAMAIKIGIVYVPQRAPYSKGVAFKFAATFTVFPISIGYEFSGGHNSKFTYQTKNYEIFLLLSCCRIGGGKNI